MIAGVVTTRTVLAHPALICRAFGFRTFLRAVRAIASGKRTTFLQIAWEG